MNKSNRRSSMQIMLSLIGLVKPMLHIMILAITLGTLGYLCAISLTILASHILLGMLGKIGFAFLLGVAVLRGILHYAEQYCNHYIAFKILAIIRHKVFAVLRKLCPAKLEGKEKGNLIAIYYIGYRIAGSFLCTYDFANCDCRADIRHYGSLHFAYSSGGRIPCTCSILRSRNCDSGHEW